MIRAPLRALIVGILSLALCRMTMSQYKLAGGVNAGGGGVMSGVANRIIGTIGQPVTGTTAGTLNKASMGFWYAQKILVTSVTPGGSTLPVVFSLDQNYPNPFNPATTIGFALPKRSHVTLTLLNTLGQQVGQLINGEVDAGYHEVKLDGTNLASGVYIYRLQAGSFVRTRTSLLLK